MGDCTSQVVEDTRSGPEDQESDQDDDRAAVIDALKQAIQHDHKSMDLNTLKELGIWEANYDEGQKFEAVVSEKISSFATLFALAMMEDKFLRKFKKYHPSTGSVKNCASNICTPNHPCRGTANTCRFSDSQNYEKNGKPKDKCCWKFAFRWHLQQAKEQKGFMIQLQEPQGLGPGQLIERIMADQVGIKVFLLKVSHTDLDSIQGAASKVSKVVQAWDKAGRTANNLEVIEFI